MNYDTENTGDDWDSYVPETAASQQVAAAPDQFTHDRVSKPKKQSISGGLGKGLLMRGVAFLAFLGFGGIFALGSTGANDLSVGDCLNMPGDEEFASVDTEGCDSAHDSQIYAIVNVPGPDTYPSDGDPYWSQVIEFCAERLETSLIRNDELPGDVDLEFFLPAADSWEANERSSKCLIWAPSGLEGSFVDPTLISS